VSRIWAIAVNTLREAIRNRILYALLFFAMVPISMSFLLSHLTVGEYHKIIMDVGLSAIALFGVLIAIFVGIGLVNREIERKTIYTIASKPVPRTSIVIGKYLGLVLVLALLVAAMGGAQLVVVVLNGVPLDAGLPIALVMTLVELLVITAFAVMYSTFTSPTLAAFFSLSTFVIGHLSADIRAFGGESDSRTVHELSAALYWVLPDLEAFNVRNEVVHDVELPLQYLVSTTAYGLLYSAVVLALGALIFHRRDF
jgi:Cu-processing system permease protein